MTRAANGTLVPDSNKWPNGIAVIAAEIHSMGLKMGRCFNIHYFSTSLLNLHAGLYGDSGTATCSGYPGSEGYETTDADTLASWGIDFWKYDNVLSNSCPFLPISPTLSFADIYSATHPQPARLRHATPQCPTP